VKRAPFIAQLAALPDDAAEQRVICAVLCEAGKLALADDLELLDFTNPRFGALLGAARNLVAADRHVGPCEAFDELVRSQRERGESPPDDLWFFWLRDMLVWTPSYEDVYGPAAIHAFEGDMRVLRKIRLSRAAVLNARKAA
jgi:hypothetical protein